MTFFKKTHLENGPAETNYKVNMQDMIDYVAASVRPITKDI